MSELPQPGTKLYAMCELFSRRNAMNGLYSKLKLPLDPDHFRDKEAIFITHMLNLADREIQEALDRGENLDNPQVQEKIQAAFYGGAAGASTAIWTAIWWNKFKRFFGLSV